MKNYFFLLKSEFYLFNRYNILFNKILSKLIISKVENIYFYKKLLL